MESGAKRYIVPYVVGLAPALLVALTWSPSGYWSLLESVVRDYAAPIVGAELFVIVVALREGLLKALPRWDWSRPALMAAATLLVIVVATAFLAPVRNDAAVLTFYWIVHGLFGLSILYLCGRIFAPGDLVRAYMVGFAVFAAQFFLFLYQIPDWDAFNWKNGFLAFSHIRHAGYYLAAIAALSIGAMAIAERRIEWVWALASATAAIGFALWTGSRGAVLAVAGSLVVGLLFVPAMRSIRGWGGGLASLIIATVVVTQVPAAPHPLLGIMRTVEATSKADPTTGRTDIWENVARAIQKRPLFGYGEGQMREVAPYSTMVQPHNSVLQVTLAWGVVGLLCILTLAFAYGRRAIPVVRRAAGVVVPALMGMAAIAILSLYDGSLYYALPISIFASCAAVIASRWSSRSEAPERRAPAQAIGDTG